MSLLILDCHKIQNTWRCHPANQHFLTQSSQSVELALSFIGTVCTDPDMSYIDSLCKLALDERFEIEASQALYGIIVESLCDDFTSDGVRLCNEVLLRIINFVRHAPQGKTINARLLAHGYPDSESLAARYERILQNYPLSSQKLQAIRKVVVLSRISVGADIAITSILVHRLVALLPTVEIVLVGPAHVPGCFSSIDQVRWLPFSYRRHGTLLSRLLVWESLEKLLQGEVQNLDHGEVIMLDPDSRLSQLGLLPLLAETDTFFFSSRISSAIEGNPTLSDLTNRWLDRLFGGYRYVPPTVSFPDRQFDEINNFLYRLRASGCRTIIVISYGVGVDERKRLGDSFELQLCSNLLARLDNSIVFLDSGSSQEENERARNQLEKYRGMGLMTDNVEEGTVASKKICFTHGIIGFHGNISGIGSLIAGADVFFGYDSCCQHLAGAVQIPSVIAFAGAPNQRFLTRWRPYDATGRTMIIPIFNRSGRDFPSVDVLVEQVVSAILSIITQCPPKKKSR